MYMLGLARGDHPTRVVENIDRKHARQAVAKLGEGGNLFLGVVVAKTSQRFGIAQGTARPVHARHVARAIFLLMHIGQHCGLSADRNDVQPVANLVDHRIAGESVPHAAQDPGRQSNEHRHEDRQLQDDRA